MLSSLYELDAKQKIFCIKKTIKGGMHAYLDNILSSIEELIQKYGDKRVYGWFNNIDDFPKDLDLWFLKHTLEQQGFDIIRIGEKFPFTLEDLCNYWQELKTSKDPIFDQFVEGTWLGSKGFGEKLDESLKKSHLDIYNLRSKYTKGGAKGLKLFRALLKNAWTIKYGQFVDLDLLPTMFKPEQYGSFLEFLKAKTADYLKLLGFQDDRVSDIMKEFPHFKSLRDEDFHPKLYVRFLENKIVNAHVSNEKAGTHYIEKAFEEVGLNTSSYALRDIAVKGGEQVLRGTEYCFKVDSNAKKYVLKKGLFYHKIKLSCPLALKGIDDKVLEDQVWYERKIHEMLLDAIVNVAKERYPSITPAKLNERFYLYIQGK